MENLMSIVVVVVAVILSLYQMKGKKKASAPGDGERQEPSAMPHRHAREGSHVSYSGKTTHNTKSGSMPHKHEKSHYRSMADASKLPTGYILLNGEPVKVSDLEEK